MSGQRVDLNLFRVFDAVMSHRSVSAASRELGVTPSAVSHALARLRQALGDELFVSGEGGMQPSARAIELAPAIREGLAQIEDALGTWLFDPARSVRTFRIATTEYGALTLLAPLVGRLARVAPHVELRVFPYSRMDVIRTLDDGRLDLVMGWFGEVPERMRRATLAVEHEAVIVRSGHPLTSDPVTLARFFGFPFAVVELTGTEEQASEGFLDDRGVWRRVWIDRLLIETGKNRDLAGHVAVSVPYYSAIPPMLRATDMVATLPLSLARAAAAEGGIAILDLPYEPLEVSMEAVWHQRSDGDAGLKWLIGEVRDLTRAGAKAADAPQASDAGI